MKWKENYFLQIYVHKFCFISFVSWHFLFEFKSQFFQFIFSKNLFIWWYRALHQQRHKRYILSEIQLTLIFEYLNIKILVFTFFSKMIKLKQNEICLFGWFVIIDVNNSSHLVLFTKLFDYNVFVSCREAWVWEYVCLYTNTHIHMLAR